MTGSHPDSGEAATRPISVAELLARHGNIGSPPVTGRRRRRRGNSGAVTVAELTGEIPVIRDDAVAPDRDDTGSRPAQPAAAAAPVRPEPVRLEPVTPEPEREPPVIGWSEPGPRWPRSLPQSARTSGPLPSPDPRPVRRSAAAGAGPVGPAAPSGAEQMSPDPVDSYPAPAIDEVDGETAAAPDPSAPARPVRRGPRRIFGRRRAHSGAGPAGLDDEDLAGLAGLAALENLQTLDALEADLADRAGASTALDEDHADIEEDLAAGPAPRRSRWAELWAGVLIVVQSLLAVAFGAGLFIAFDQLWRWNNIVALVLTVLVTLGLVAAVQAVRRTVDIASTLTAVAVGLLVTLGPLALHVN